MYALNQTFCSHMLWPMATKGGILNLILLFLLELCQIFFTVF
jgi:hypothetical protein